MSSPSDAASGRSSAAGEETKSRLSRKRVTVITATALSLLEACGLEPSPARSEKTAGKGKKATQGEPPAEKASADGLGERQAAGSASSRERNGGRKKRSASDRAPREVADAVPQEAASQGVAATKAAFPEISPVISPADTTAATVPPGSATPSKKTSARRRRASGTKTAPVTDTAPAFTSETVGQMSSSVAGPSVGQAAVEAATSVPGEDQLHSGARRRAVSRAGHPSTSGGRGRKKAAATPPASAGEAVSTTAPVPEQQPAERPMDAAALAAEADRLAAEYGLSSSGGGLVVLPGDDDWDDFPPPLDREAPSARTAAHVTETVPSAPFPEPVPSAASFAAASPVALVPEATPAEVKSSPKRRRAGSPKAAPVAESGPVPASEAVAQMAPPVAEPFATSNIAAADAAVPAAGLPQPAAGKRAAPRAGCAIISGGRGHKKTAATTPASAGEAVPTTAPVPEQQPAERPMDAAALAAEADRLAAEYGLSSSGGGLVVLPGDDDWDDFPPPLDREAPSTRAVAHVTETVPATSFPESVPAAASFDAAAAAVAPVPEATPAEGQSSPRRRRGGGTAAASVAGSGNASVPLAGEKGGASPAAPGDARIPEGSPAPVQGAVSSASAGHRAEGEANGTARPAASPVAGAPCPAPASGTGMGRREAAFRQWAADMQARFDAGLEAEEDRAARRKDSLVVLPPPTDTGGRKRRTAKKAQADAAEAPRPRTWITRRRSTEPGHEARFEEWHGPARTGSVLEKVFISLGASPEQAKLSRLWRSWDAVLGPDLAPLARPLGHHDDKLLIGAEDAVLLQELYYMGPEIVRRVNEFLQEDFFTAVKVSLMLDHQDLDAPSPVLERSAGRPKEEVPAPSGASLGLMDPESAVARCYARFLGMELPDPRK